MDDNQDARFVLSAVLNYDGYRVLLAENGADALEQVREHAPALILMDIRMPVMDGISAAQALRDDDATRELPIIAVTADPLVGAQADEAGQLFDEVLLKPIAPSDLMRVVREHIGAP